MKQPGISETVTQTMSADDLTLYLEESGTGAKRVQTCYAYCKAHPKATAEDLYVHLESEGIPEGTLRKAGEKIWGAGFNPSLRFHSNPEDEIAQLRTELAQVKKQMLQVTTSKNGYVAKITHLEGRVRDLIRENQMLKIGRKPDELAGLTNEAVPADVA